jgi:hypothetical protein
MGMVWTARVGPNNFLKEPIRIPYGSRTGPPAGLPAGIPCGPRGQKLTGPIRVNLMGTRGCTRRDPNGTRTGVFAGLFKIKLHFNLNRNYKICTITIF